MSRTLVKDTWIDSLSADELRSELAELALPTGGPVSALRNRLIEHYRRIHQEMASPQTPEDRPPVSTAPPALQLPVDERQSPQSTHDPADPGTTAQPEIIESPAPVMHATPVRHSPVPPGHHGEPPHDLRSRPPGTPPSLRNVRISRGSHYSNDEYAPRDNLPRMHRTYDRPAYDGHATFASPPRSNGPPNTLAAYEVMRKWKLQFSGSRAEDSEAFLTRIAEGRVLFNLRDSDILNSLPFFLSGVAPYWYRAKRGMWRDFQDLEHAWRERFSNPNMQFALREEIRKRTQGENEPVADYLTYMRAYYDRLRPAWHPEDELDYSYRNLLPRFQVLIRREEIADQRPTRRRRKALRDQSQRRE